MDMYSIQRQTIFRAFDTHQLNAVFRRVFLYISIFCITNTLFFVVITRTSSHPAAISLEHQLQQENQVNTQQQTKIKVKVKVYSKSLLRLLLENCLYASSAGAEREADDEIKKVEYISQENPLLFAITYNQSQFGIHFSPFSYLNSFLDTLTPPPKRLV
jgi:hypothetical protein